MTDGQAYIKLGSCTGSPRHGRLDLQPVVFKVAPALLKVAIAQAEQRCWGGHQIVQLQGGGVVARYEGGQRVLCRTPPQS